MRLQTVVVAVSLVTGVVGCDDGSPELPDRPTSPPPVEIQPSEPERRPTGVARGGSPSHEQESEAHLSRFRLERLELRTLPAPGGRLAFGRRVLGRLTASEMQVFETERYRLIASTPTLGHTQIISSHDGGLLAIDQRQTWRLMPREVGFRVYPRPTFFTNSQLLGDPTDYEALQVFHRQPPAVYQYALQKSEAPILPILHSVQLESAGPAPAFATLRDGSFALGSGHRITSTRPSGSSKQYSLRSADQKIARIVAGPSIRQLWVLWEDRALQLVDLAAKQAQVVLQVQLPNAVLDLDADASALFLLELRGTDGNARRFYVTKRDPRGIALFSVDLGPLTDARGPDWMARALADKHLALSRFEPLFAVGGDSALRFFSAKTGKLLFEQSGNEP